jgi:hypothetical protein
MKITSKIVCTGFILFLLLSSNIHSQTIAETLSNLSSDAVLKYSEPVISAFGSSMNSGWFTGLPASSNGIHAKLRFVGVGSFFSDDLRTFNHTGNLRLTSSQVDEILSRDWEVIFNGPTITGNYDDYLKVDFPSAEVQGYTIDQYTLELTDVRGYLDNIDVMPSPALQFDLGSLIGTGVSILLMASKKAKNVSDRHSRAGGNPVFPGCSGLPPSRE